MEAVTAVARALAPCLFLHLRITQDALPPCLSPNLHIIQGVRLLVTCQLSGGLGLVCGARRCHLSIHLGHEGI